MGYYLGVNEEIGEDLASVSGWGDIIRWAESLPRQQYGTLFGFCWNGESDRVSALRHELRTALVSAPPTAEGALVTAENLLRMLGEVEDNAVVWVSDGMVAGDEDDEEEDDNQEEEPEDGER